MEANGKSINIPPESLNRTGINSIILLGIIFPIFALAFNLWLTTKMPDFDMLYTVGAMFLLPRTAYLYVIIGSGIATLLLWLVYFRKHGKHCNGFIGGILLFNALFYFMFGVMGVIRLLIIPVWLPPFCAVPALVFAGIKSLKTARTVIPNSKIILSAIAGAIFVVVLSLTIVRQPWGFIVHLPDASGADFSGMDLSNIYLEGASDVTFEGANFSFANLHNSCFVHCNINMQNVDMDGTNLTNSVLSFVNLKGANLRNANLNKAMIYEVDFTGADFQGASMGFYARGRIIMKDVNLCGADLSQLKDIGGVYGWEDAKYDTSTLWPTDFNPQAYGMVFVESKN